MNYFAAVPHTQDATDPALVRPVSQSPTTTLPSSASAPLDSAHSPPISARPRNSSIPEPSGTNLPQAGPSSTPLDSSPGFSTFPAAAGGVSGDRPYPFYNSNDSAPVGGDSGTTANEESTQTAIDHASRPDGSHVDGREEPEEARNPPQQPSVASPVQPQSSPVAAVPQAVAQPFPYVSVAPGGYFPGAMPFPALYPAMPHYMPPVVPAPQATTPPKPKRRQVKNACTACQRACKKCDDCRPCVRCVKYGISDECMDSERKERRKGMKRGPYKKRETKPAVLEFSPSHLSAAYNQAHMHAGEAAPAAHLHNALSYYPGYAGLPPPPTMQVTMGGFLKPDGVPPYPNAYGYYISQPAPADGATPTAAPYPYAFPYAPPYATYAHPPGAVDHNAAAAGAYSGLYGSAPPSGESDAGSSARRASARPSANEGGEENRTPTARKTPAPVTPRSPTKKRTPRSAARTAEPTPA